jgi:hypothetical protein
MMKRLTCAACQKLPGAAAPAAAWHSKAGSESAAAAGSAVAGSSGGAAAADGGEGADSSAQGPGGRGSGGGRGRGKSPAKGRGRGRGRGHAAVIAAAAAAGSIDAAGASSDGAAAAAAIAPPAAGGYGPPLHMGGVEGKRCRGCTGPGEDLCLLCRSVAAAGRSAFLVRALLMLTRSPAAVCCITRPLHGCAALGRRHHRRVAQPEDHQQQAGRLATHRCGAADLHSPDSTQPCGMQSDSPTLRARPRTPQQHTLRHAAAALLLLPPVVSAARSTEAAIAAARGAARTILLTGTPSLSRPYDLYRQVDVLQPGMLGRTKEDFADRWGWAGAVTPGSVGVSICTLG